MNFNRYVVHPHVLLVPLLAGVLASGAADAAGLLDRINPFASFEARCAAIPAGQIEVLAAPVTFVEDGSQSLATLSVMKETANPRHRTVGLTQARLGYEATLETRGLADPVGGRVCTRPAIRVVFSAAPMTVYIARELADNPCRREMIRDHEMRHVGVYREYLDELVERARGELPALFGSGVHFAADMTTSRTELRERLQAFMRTFMQARYAEVRARHAAIDTADEYARLGYACLAPG